MEGQSVTFRPCEQVEFMLSITASSTLPFETLTADIARLLRLSLFIVIKAGATT
ncbi:hypothetical protein M378DRAFT_173924 [Amanita muscaria Koide BX008]|uniref:Uncharacterized protein n=1 Tax=Amanita muscaria (strain Koide BX008) TaxID=946122 RepID=A0A0C2WEI4_AMAMK|nr:hypothetical protein M378DRAFT_173924 [Amanita muscaria Koide BX008]